MGAAGSRSERPRGTAKGELALIERIRRAAHKVGHSPEVRLGIGDDCAILRPRRGEEIVVTTDFSIEGRHFRRDWHSPSSAGHRCLARGLSDLAAMGARPVAAFLSLALPQTVATEGGWLDGFLRGLLGLAARTGTALAGGDTSQGPGDGVVADIVLLGSLPQGSALLRSGARPGDALYVTGSLGGAAAELRQLARTPQVDADAALPGAHPQLFPEPRLQAGMQLRRRGLAGAAMDLSDGLSTDLHHLCEASGVAAEIDADLLPLHRLTEALPREERLHLALHGGEDYELLFAAPPGTRVPRRLGGTTLTRIGTVLPRARRTAVVSLLRPGGKREPLAAGGWEHLR